MVVFFEVYFSVWFCTHGVAEIVSFTVLFVCSFATVTMIRVDTLSYYHRICRHTQSQTVSAHIATSECCSSHIETEILAMNISN